MWCKLISTFVFSFSLICSASAEPAESADTYHEPFSEARLETLQDEGQPVLVQVHADWCSTCEAQSEALDRLADHESFQNLTVLRLDWDSQKQAASDMDVWRQSTLVLYAGEEEVDRTVATTGYREIGRFIASAYGCD